MYWHEHSERQGELSQTIPENATQHPCRDKPSVNTEATNDDVMIIAK